MGTISYICLSRLVQLAQLLVTTLPHLTTLAIPIELPELARATAKHPKGQLTLIGPNALLVILRTCGHHSAEDVCICVWNPMRGEK